MVNDLILQLTMSGKVVDKKEIILFDGVCNLCNYFVRFVIRHDRKGRFSFASLQSETGRNLLAAFPGNQQLKTVVLISGNKIYNRSSAALRVAKGLGGLWPLLYGLMIVPRSLRDAVYNRIAKNRYRWFGKSDTCMVPTPELKARFL